MEIYENITLTFNPCRLGEHKAYIFIQLVPRAPYFVPLCTFD
jgi:hypothetical protein